MLRSNTSRIHPPPAPPEKNGKADPRRKMGVSQREGESAHRERDLRVRASALLVAMSPTSVEFLRSSLQQVHDQARHKWILHPLSPLKTLWDLLGAFCVIYYSWMVPVMLAFDWYKPSPETERSMRALDVWGMLDVALRFRTGIIQDGAVVMAPSAIARAYAHSMWLPIDLLASIPFEIVLGDSNTFTSNSPKTLLIIKYFKLPRLLRIPRYFKHVREYRRYSSLTIPLNVVLFGAHVAACLWVALIKPCSSEENSSEYCQKDGGRLFGAYWVAFEHGVTSLLGISSSHVEWSDRFLQAGFQHTYIPEVAYMWSTAVSLGGSLLSAVLFGATITIAKRYQGTLFIIKRIC